ncbi:sigma factor-like helix-turn-helix DNA-binding protein [Demequina lignilytica]|uniref:Sigma factor-like helix-turn-helix DNA-binding protein n=1 Tax=Demequina lignilytica TaxID=3051663 RepID=A0AB35MLE4_9MICO|nr:sigma factor-like helix-turn-helix DNA-binding protein [Demequina sp. SYSU T0a273]MDN4484405.1 sigma factor-like helix-turn-helix DNA-binding protein [Demequina sp. SYSU T0a273]
MRTWSRVLDAMLREHGEELYSRAFALTGHAGSADQVLEDALVAAFRGVRVPDVAEARAGTLRAMHRALARRRAPADRRDAGPALDEVADAPEHRSGARPDSALHANVVAARDFVADHPPYEDDVREALVADISSLSPDERVCLVLRCVDGMSTADLAAETGLSGRRVQAVLERAVRRLAERRPWLALDLEVAVWGGDEETAVEVDR